MSPPGPHQERRKKKRIQLTRGIIARFGPLGVVIMDITDVGARIEHFTRLEIGKRSRFRMEWQERELVIEAQVRSCRVHRFAPGEETIYQSGLAFVDLSEETAAILKDMVATIVARSLAEQVANARGIGPVIERNMPVFRAGAVVADGLDPNSEKARRFIPDSAIVVERGYIRCTLVGTHWNRKWTKTSDQPEEGFTVNATEPEEHIDQLCQTYLKGNADDRRLIQLLARVSVEKQEETPEPPVC
jgi:hypothetical protein